MLKLALGTLGLLVLGTLAPTPPPPPLCRVEATSAPRPYLGDREVRVQVRPGCPPGGYARLRYASAYGGVLPAAPPGYFVLRPGFIHGKPVGAKWWLEWIDQTGRTWRVPENTGG